MIRLCAFSDEAADSLDGQIAALKRNGIALTELRSVDGVNVSALSVARAKEIARALNADGISVWSVGSPLGKRDLPLPACLGEWADEVKRICEIAVALGTDKIRAFSFFNAYTERERVLDRLNDAARIACKFSVTLYHENEKEIFGDTPSRVLDLMNNLVGWKFIYDPANFVQCGAMPNETLSLAARCEYFHIKDVVAQSGELVPAGDGDCDIAALLAALDGDRVLTVEPHLAIFPSYKQIDGSEMKLRYHFSDKASAFDAAVSALKNLLRKCGYNQASGDKEYIKL